jgi:hypothetical protein
VRLASPEAVATVEEEEGDGEEEEEEEEVLPPAVPLRSRATRDRIANLRVNRPESLYDALNADSEEEPAGERRPLPAEPPAAGRSWRMMVSAGVNIFRRGKAHSPKADGGAVGGSAKGRRHGGGGGGGNGGRRLHRRSSEGDAAAVAATACADEAARLRTICVQSGVPGKLRSNSSPPVPRAAAASVGSVGSTAGGGGGRKRMVSVVKQFAREKQATCGLYTSQGLAGGSLEMSGYLERLLLKSPAAKAKGTSTVRRWCVIRTGDLLLFQSKEEEECRATPLAVLDLDEYVSFRHMPGPSPGQPSQIFEIVCPQRTYTMKARTTDELEMWMHSLLRAQNNRRRVGSKSLRLSGWLHKVRNGCTKRRCVLPRHVQMWQVQLCCV